MPYNKEYNQTHTPKPIPCPPSRRGMVQTVRWIPANEAVPNDTRDVLAVAYGETSNIHLIGALEIAFYENGKWYSANIVDDDRANMLELDVTAWMEFPNILEQYDELSDTEAANGQ